MNGIAISKKLIEPIDLRARARSLARLGVARMAPALLTAGLLMLSFPSPDQGWLAWVALAPLIVACRGLGPGASFSLGLLSGMAFSMGSFGWFLEIPSVGLHHGLIGAFYLGLYPAAWCAGLAVLNRSRLPVLLTGPGLWVALDYLRAHAGFLAIPWATLAHSQHDNLAVLQVAALAGEYGVTFLVVVGNVAIAGLLMQRAWRSAAAAGLLIALVHAGGAVAISMPGSSHRLQVAAVQPSILNSEVRTRTGRAAVLDRLERLTRTAAESHPALIAWPETAVGDLGRNPVLFGRVRSLVRATGVPLIAGSSEKVKFSRQSGGGLPHIEEFNSAYFFDPGGMVGKPYRKRILVPFGEYVPLESFIRWPTWLVPPGFDTVAGDEPGDFLLPDGTKLSVVICWENMFSGLIRSSVRDGAQLIVHPANDNWLGRTAASRQHNLGSVLRAVENRVPVVTVSNTGPSQIIGPRGRILAQVPELFSEGIATAAVPAGGGGTFYTRFGDVFAAACILASLLSMAYALWSSRGSSRPRRTQRPRPRDFPSAVGWGGRED